MRQRVMTALLPLCFAGLLTACASPAAPAPEIRLVKPSIPSSLLACLPRPPIPDATSQRAVALLLVKIDSAGDDCRQKLAAVVKALGL